MINPKLAKKDVEYNILRRFISHETHGLRIKDIEPSETPDFILHELHKTISVELTELRHQKLKQKESFQEKIVEAAWSKFRKKYNANIQVLVNFSDVPIKASANEVQRYVDELHDLVERIWLNNRDYEFRLTNMGRSRKRDHWIDSISVNNVVDLEYWQPFGAFKVGRADPSWIKKVIEGKEAKLANYQKSFDERWLLMVANFGDRSSTHDIFFLETGDLQTKFDRVYLYKYMDNTYKRIK
jgi:hypothetical protein